MRTQVAPYLLLGNTIADIPNPAEVAQGYLFHESATGTCWVLSINETTGLRRWEPFCGLGTALTGGGGGGGGIITAGLLDFADFFALMPGDNAATIALGAPVLFPQNGATAALGITRVSAGVFNLAAVGIYEVDFQVSVSEAGQLEVTLNGVVVPSSVVGRATGTSQIVGVSLITTTVPNTQLRIINPAGNPAALTITPVAGGASAVSAHLVIKRYQ